MGATNICWVASRFAARGGDTRALPNIPYRPSDPLAYSKAFAPFDDQWVAGVDDPAGDTYYFWTLAYASLATRHSPTGAVTGRLTTRYGAFCMRFVRDHVARHSTTSSHLSAVMLGEAAGPYLAHIAEQRIELQHQNHQANNLRPLRPLRPLRSEVNQLSL